MTGRFALTTLTRAAEAGEVRGALWLGDLDGVSPILELRDEPLGGPGLRGLAQHRGRFVVGVWGAVWLVEADGRVTMRLTCPALRDVHAIAVQGDRAFVCATGSDCVLGLDLVRCVFDWGLLLRDTPSVFDPRRQTPDPGDSLHLNQVCVTEAGLVLSGLRSSEVLLLDKDGTLGVIDEVPPGTHDVRPHAGGLLFNDTARDRTLWRGPDRSVAVPVPRFPLEELTGVHAADGGMARQAFARGLAVLSDGRVLVGSSPGTVSLIDPLRGRHLQSLTFEPDLRVAVHAISCHVDGV